MDILVDTNWLEENLDDPQTRVIDCTILLDQGEDGSFSFVSGEAVWKDEHIPGAINVYAMDIVDPHTMRYLDEARLRELFSVALDQPETRAIAYCGVGIGATSAVFTLHRLGHEKVSVYDGSLAEWSADPSLPMTIDD